MEELSKIVRGNKVEKVIIIWLTYNNKYGKII
jgi:hypothetical protein